MYKVNPVKTNLNNCFIAKVEGYLISLGKLQDRQLKVRHKSWKGRQAQSKALLETEGHLKKLVSFSVWYKYGCSGSVTKEKATVSCYHSRH